MSENSCGRCQKAQAQLDQALKQCARCHKTKYCSTTCQRADWPEHKRQCAKPRRTSDELMAIRMRATYGTSSGSSNIPEDETIFYLEKSTPHLDDISIAGPFHPRKAILEQLKAYFQQGHSLAGFLLVSEFDDEEDALRSLTDVKAPLDDDVSKFMIVNIISEHNPDMARKLPCPVFNIIRSVPLLPEEIAERNALQGPSPYARVKEMKVLGSYSSAEEAIVKAKDLSRLCEGELQQLERHRDEGDSWSPSQPQDGGAVFSDVLLGRDRDGRFKGIVVDVRYDSGTIRYPPVPRGGWFR